MPWPWRGRGRRRQPIGRRRATETPEAASWRVAFLPQSDDDPVRPTLGRTTQPGTGPTVRLGFTDGSEVQLGAGSRGVQEFLDAAAHLTGRQAPTDR
jgi:hypothetical protein